jgi:hypothetical protein
MIETIRKYWRIFIDDYWWIYAVIGSGVLLAFYFMFEVFKYGG